MPEICYTLCTVLILYQNISSLLGSHTQALPSTGIRVQPPNLLLVEPKTTHLQASIGTPSQPTIQGLIFYPLRCGYFVPAHFFSSTLCSVNLR